MGSIVPLMLMLLSQLLTLGPSIRPWTVFENASQLKRTLQCPEVLMLEFSKHRVRLLKHPFNIHLLYDLPVVE